MNEPTLQTVDRALTLLELLSHKPDGLRATDLASEMQLNKVTIHRLVNTLAKHGFIEKANDGIHWQLGLKLIALSSMRLNSLELKTEAQPYLRRLVQQCEQPVHLAIRDDTEIVYIEKIETVQTMRMYSQIGKRSPVYSTALGKALLTGLSELELSALLSKLSMQPITPGTLTSVEALSEEVKKATSAGYAFDIEENEAGVFCIAAPVYDYRGHVIAAISTAGNRRDFLDDPTHPMIDQVKEAALSVSRRMGYSV